MTHWLEDRYSDALACLLEPSVVELQILIGYTTILWAWLPASLRVKPILQLGLTKDPSSWI